MKKTWFPANSVWPGFSVALVATTLSLGCQQPNSSSQSGVINGASSQNSAGSSAPSSSASSTSGLNAISIVTKADPSGSFDATSVPVAGGIAAKAQRLFNLDGSAITSGTVPAWFVESRLFLTSTRTSTGIASNVTSDTPCAYFDSYSTDINPDTSGYYTIDGYSPNSGSTDVDQCAGTAAAELNKVGLYINIDRRFMNATDKLQLIIKAKPLDSPNTAPTVSNCVTGGFFDAGACSNLYYTVTMRTAPYASAKPFFILFPSAKSMDLLSEQVLVPINNYSNIATISIDRVKGGVVLYGVSVIRMQ
jgi:hypothetical protein